MTILLIDSDEKALDKVREELISKKFTNTIFLYSSGSDAIKFVMHNDVDAVFTRSILKDMTGQELVEELHRFKDEIECYIFTRYNEISLDKILNLSTRNQVLDNKQESYFDESPKYEKKKEDEKTMNEQELRNLNRKELLEIMIEQAKELESCKEQYEKDLTFLKSEHKNDIEMIKRDYEKEIISLKEELQKSRKILQNREIKINEAGSIAVAALQLNGVFEAAQAASQQYIENVRILSERQASICAQRDARNKAELEQRLKETEEKCANMEYICRRKCEDMEAEAKRRSEAYWTEVRQRLQSFYDNHKELKKLLNFDIANMSE